MKARIRQPSQIVFPQPLEERVDKAAERQLAGRGPLSREQGRRDPDDEKGWWWHDGEGDWAFYGEEDPP